MGATIPKLVPVPWIAAPFFDPPSADSIPIIYGELSDDMPIFLEHADELEQEGRALGLGEIYCSMRYSSAILVFDGHYAPHPPNGGPRSNEYLGAIILKDLPEEAKTATEPLPYLVEALKKVVAEKPRQTAAQLDVAYSGSPSVIPAPQPTPVYSGTITYQDGSKQQIGAGSLLTRPTHKAPVKRAKSRDKFKKPKRAIALAGLPED